MVTTEDAADGAIRIVRIGRPDKRNAVDTETAEALLEAFLAFDGDDTAKVAILTGDDAAFCAGADLGAPPRLRPSGPLGPTRLQLSKPVIGAIEGWCVAGGLELAAWCDLRVAGSSARFGCLERRWGVPLIDGGTQRLPRIVGLGRALDLILTGREIGSDEAERIGFVNRVVVDGTALQEALALADNLVSVPWTCAMSDRQAVYEGLGRTLEEGLAIEDRLGQEVILAPGFREGLQRFFDHQKERSR